MAVMRRWVFPTLRLVVFAAIAAALVKLAFFGGLTEATDTSAPTGSVNDPTVTVDTGTVKSDVVLDATISADAAAPVRATAAGEVVKVLVATGQQVAVGAPVATVRTASADGVTPGIVRTLTTAAAGTVSDVPVLAGQQLSVGDVVAQVAPPTFSVVGTMPPEQQYRLVNRPTEGTVVVTGGPTPFTCTGLTISTPLAGAADGSSASSPDASTTGGTGATTTVRCAVPGDVTVFSGIAAKLTVSGGVAEKALTVPVTAVSGAPGGAGKVWTVGDDGKPTAKEVRLGVTDGKVVEVQSGVAEGDEVLEYVPGADSTASADSAASASDG